MIRGYKSFSSNGTNQAHEIMEAGKKYHCDGIIKYNKNGYHLATNFEDTIAFSDIVDSDGNSNDLHDVIIAEVIGSGDIDKVSDMYANYYGYFDMYACSDIEIVRFIPREELMKMALELNNVRMERFVSYLKMSSEELKLFQGYNIRVDAAIEYYHNNNKSIYEIKNYQKLIKRKYKRGNI